MANTPLHHIVRIRSNDDLKYVNPSLMDEIIINANQLENSSQSTAAVLWDNHLPFSVDPILWRFQEPLSIRNRSGDTKRNYTRLGAAYAKGTDIRITAGPILYAAPSDDDWRTLASNVIEYQRNHLAAVPTQLDLLSRSQPRELRPIRLLAPALITHSPVEDRINRLLVEESVAVTDDPVAVQVIVPIDRLIDESQLDRILESIPREGVNAYLVWIPLLTEERLLAGDHILSALHRLIAELAERGISVGHQYANYSIAALHEFGLAAATHHLGWTDNAEPITKPFFGGRSCQTYVPGVRHSLRFPEASKIGRSLDQTTYAERYCECRFCVGSFDAGQHPLDLLLESQIVVQSNGRERQMPTSRAIGTNTWHYLLSRRLEIQAFSEFSASDVIERDIERAATLNGTREATRLVRLASELKSA